VRRYKMSDFYYNVNGRTIGTREEFIRDTIDEQLEYFEVETREEVFDIQVKNGDLITANKQEGEMWIDENGNILEMSENWMGYEEEE
jgi:frataxin-like iron-binding protein CyaY